MQVQDVMSVDPVCCLSMDTAQDAALLMERLDVGIIPVVDSKEENKLLGVITDRDLCLNIVAHGQLPGTVSAEECMTPEPVCCSPDDSLETVIALMKEHQLHRIPVVDQGHSIKGIVSLADVALSNCAPLELSDAVRQISWPFVL